MNVELRPSQIEAMAGRFGDVLDVRREIESARAYLENIHAGRKPKVFARFVWNWLRGSEERRLARMTPRQREELARGRRGRSEGTPGPERTQLSRGQLEAIANDEKESPTIREFAQEQLETTCTLF